MLLALLFAASTLVQFGAAYLAFRLNWVYGRRLPWLLICAALLLMALRRSLALYRFLANGWTGPPKMWDETDLLLLPQAAVSLAASVLILAGVALIEPLFRQMVRNASHMEEANHQLRAQVRRYEFDLNLAAQIQAGLLPNQVPDVEGVDLAGLCLPAESIGGDFYDYIPLPLGKIAIIVADVSGHGLGPALLMAEVRAYIWALAASRGSIAECLMGANRFLLSGTGAGQYFVTAFLAELDPAAGCFTYAAAGHEGYLLNPRGGFTRLASDGLPLGLDEGMCYGQAGVLQLGPGQILVLMTDGITEAVARDGAYFGVDRAMEIVKRHRHLAARDIVVALYEGVRQFSPGSAPDDRTIVILKSDRGAKLRCSGRRREAISGATCGTL